LKSGGALLKQEIVGGFGREKFKRESKVVFQHNILEQGSSDPLL
jgi:hypothetical protein